MHADMIQLLTITLFVITTINDSVAIDIEREYPKNSFAMCSKIPSFLRTNTNLKCSNKRTKMEIWYNGTRAAKIECEYHFRMRPWNCSSSPESLPRIVNHAFPETAFLYSIHSAGLAYSLATACASGKSECKCNRNKEEKYIVQGNPTFQQAGGPTIVLEDKACTKDSLKYGIEESRNLLKNVNAGDIRWKVDEHNKEAGRLALIDSTVNNNKLCSCHGVSGACTITKCILRLPKYREVSTFLMEKYKSAVRVGSDNNGRKLIVFDSTMKKHTDNDLLYMENSPEFCEKNLKQGSLGTKGRSCNKDSPGPDGCDVLCCNRGYNTIRVKKMEKCNCKFKYCCNVSCKECERTYITHVCK